MSTARRGGRARCTEDRHRAGGGRRSVRTVRPRRGPRSARPPASTTPARQLRQQAGVRAARSSRLGGLADPATRLVPAGSRPARGRVGGSAHDGEHGPSPGCRPRRSPRADGSSASARTAALPRGLRRLDPSADPRSTWQRITRSCHGLSSPRGRARPGRWHARPAPAPCRPGAPAHGVAGGGHGEVHVRAVAAGHGVDVEGVDLPRVPRLRHRWRCRRNAARRRAESVRPGCFHRLPHLRVR